MLCAIGEAAEPKCPTRGVRLPESLDRIVEGRTTPALTRATVIIDLIGKRLSYEHLRQTKGDPSLGELIALMDEMLAACLTKATTEIYRDVFVECLILRKLPRRGP